MSQIEKVAKKKKIVRDGYLVLREHGDGGTIAVRAVPTGENTRKFSVRLLAPPEFYRRAVQILKQKDGWKHSTVAAGKQFECDTTDVHELERLVNLVVHAIQACCYMDDEISLIDQIGSTLHEDLLVSLRERKARDTDDEMPKISHARRWSSEDLFYTIFEAEGLIIWF